MANELITAATGAVPALAKDVYLDLLHPSASRVGLSLETLTKVALSPISILDWGFEQSKEWLKSKIETRLRSVPPEFLVQPSIGIVSASMQHIATSYDTPELRELYTELLLKAMDSRTAPDVHPAYFFIIEQLAPQEALVLVGLHELGRTDLFQETIEHIASSPGTQNPIEKQFLQFCEATLGSNIDQSGVWLKNLCRLGVLELLTSSEAVFKPEDFDLQGSSAARVDNKEHKSLIFTDFGKHFISACAPELDSRSSAY